MINQVVGTRADADNVGPATVFIGAGENSSSVFITTMSKDGNGDESSDGNFHVDDDDNDVRELVIVETM